LEGKGKKKPFNPEVSATITAQAPLLFTSLSLSRQLGKNDFTIRYDYSIDAIGKVTAKDFAPRLNEKAAFVSLL